MGRLQDKVAIVTGSSSGLGRAISIRYATEGAKVVCADLTPDARPEKSEEVATATHDAITKAGGQAIFVKIDAGDATDMENLVAKAVDAFGAVHVMVNNAGIAIESKRPAPCALTSVEDWDETMRVNSRSVFLGCKFALTQMMKQEPLACGGRGWVINVSSIYGLVGGSTNPSYSASKGAVANLTRQIASDYASHGIHVNAISPGHVQTAIFVHTMENQSDEPELRKRYPSGTFGQPDDIAKMAVVLASDDASWVHGSVVPVDGGYTCI